MNRSLRVVLFIFLAISLVFKVAAQSSRVREIIILHTNDMHAKIDNMARLAYLADSLRKMHEFVFLLSAGDNFTGNPVVDMVEDKGYPMIDLMNACGFNLSTIGNHEFDLGQDKLNKRVTQAGFPFICCNIDASGAVFKQPEPYYLLKAGEIEIPVLGVIQLGENGLPDSHPSRLEGIKFMEGLEKAREFSWLKTKYGMLIGLTHLGVEGDEPLAKAMPEFDIIIGGHSHTTMTKPMLVNDVMIVQAGSGLKNVGKLTLKVQDREIIDKQYELISLARVSPAVPDVQRMIDKYNDNEELNRTIGIAKTALDGEDELGSLMTDAITDRLGVDFAFQNIGGIRISSLPAGEIRLKDVYRLDPFGNNVVIYRMSLSEIRSLICNSFNRDKQPDLEVSGMSYTILTGDDGYCADVKMSDNSGIPLDDKKTYTVGVNSYIAASYRFEHADQGQSSKYTSAEALIEFLGSRKSVDYKGVKRVYVGKLKDTEKK